MDFSPLTRLTPFVGVGVGGGIGVGCGVGVGSGTGGQGTPSRFSSAPPLLARAPRPRPAASPSARPSASRPFSAPSVAPADAAWTRKRLLSRDYDALRPALPRRAPPPKTTKTTATENYGRRARRLLRTAAADPALARPPAPPSVARLVAVRFTWAGAVTRSVFLAGSFNAWGAPVPLRDAGPGWARVVKLPVGTHYYRFIVDGEWAVDEERRVVRLENYGRGGGCGFGLGFGWGFFLYGIGAPIWKVSTMVGHESRMMDRAYKKAEREREAGIRPPIGTPPAVFDAEPDPLLDRILRIIQTRRARKGSTTKARFRIAQ